jgi:hypothetical protein
VYILHIRTYTYMHEQNIHHNTGNTMLESAQQ